MRARLRQTWHRERGQSLVEMGVVAVILLMLLGAVADFGRLMHDYIIIMNAAREGARYGSHFPWKGNGIRDAAIAEAADSGLVLEYQNITVSPEPPPDGDPEDPGVALPGDPLAVYVEYNFDTMLGGFVGFDAIAVRAQCQMVVFGADDQENP